MSRKEMPVKERVKDSMYALGLPIVQGAISTVLGVIGLALAPSYIFLTFFKMVLLVIVLGALHGLILLPVLLSFLGPDTCCGLQTETNSDSRKKNSKKSGEKPALSSPKKPQKQEEICLEDEPEVSLRIPRPKRSTSSTSDFHLNSNGNSNGKSNGNHEAGNASAMKLHEMYTNRAFQD